MLKKLFSQSIYVKIFENKFFLRNIHEDEELAIFADEPFSTNRLLIGNFSRAEKTLKSGVAEIHKNRFISASPLILMHPVAMVDGGLSPVEESLFKELAASVGARETIIWVGHELSDEEVEQKLVNM